MAGLPPTSVPKDEGAPAFLDATEPAELDAYRSIPLAPRWSLIPFAPPGAREPSGAGYTVRPYTSSPVSSMS